jgi:opacity protein-like surface antigen
MENPESAKGRAGDRGRHFNMNESILKNKSFYRVLAIATLLGGLFISTPVLAGDYGSSGQPYFSLATQVVSADAMAVNPGLGIVPGSFLTGRGISIDTELGWGITGAVGWLYDSNWHYEVELGHKALELGEAFSPGNPGTLKGEFNVETFFLNGGYDFRTDSFATPYIAIGLGVGLTELTINEINGAVQRFEEQLTVTPYAQAKVGLNLEVADDMDITIGYRYTSSLTTLDFPPIDLSRMDSHNFELGLKFYIEDWIN